MATKGWGGVKKIRGASEGSFPLILILWAEHRLDVSLELTGDETRQGLHFKCG